MTQNLGFVQVTETISFLFTTADGAGGAVAPSSAFEAADIRIYKDGSGTQRSSSNGITMTSPFDSVVGLHQVSIDTGNNTDAGFWSPNSNYEVVLVPDTETVDGQTVVSVLARFTVTESNLYTQLDAIEVDAAQAGNGIRRLISFEDGVGDTGNTVNTVHLPNLTYGDDELNSHLIILFDDSTGLYHARWITAFDSATKLASISPDLPAAPQDNTDSFWICQIRRDMDVALFASNFNALIGLAYMGSTFYSQSAVPSIVTSGSADDVADAILARNINGGGSGGRTVGEALAFNRNKWAIVGTTLTIYDTDDTTPLWTAELTRVSADAVSAFDPA